MGFSDVRARKGLINGSTVEGAVNWLEQHENDPDIDQPYMVRKADTMPKKQLTAEEKAARLEEMRNKIKNRREEKSRDEKAAEIKREKDRRERGQMLQETQEDRDRLARKREAEKQKREKDLVSGGCVVVAWHTRTCFCVLSCALCVVLQSVTSCHAAALNCLFGLFLLVSRPS